MTSPDRVRVLIADNHAAVRDGLVAFLDAFADLAIVGQAGSGKEALYLCSCLQPDVVLMDLLMDDLDGVTATRLIRQLYSNVQVVALTCSNDKDLLDAAQNAGAFSTLKKDITASELLNAIHAAHSLGPCAANHSDTTNASTRAAACSHVNGLANANTAVSSNPPLTLSKGKHRQD